jgi:hypothetical protein
MAGAGGKFSIFDSTFGLSSKNFDSVVRFSLISPFLSDLASLVEEGWAWRLSGIKHLV